MTGRTDYGATHRDFGTICPEVQRVWGAPQQAFLRALRPAKISECGHTRIACQNAKPATWRKKRRLRFYVSSVSFDAFIAWIVASTIFNSLSSKAFNMASIRFLHSLPLFWDG